MGHFSEGFWGFLAKTFAAFRRRHLRYKINSDPNCPKTNSFSDGTILLERRIYGLKYSPSFRQPPRALDVYVLEMRDENANKSSPSRRFLSVRGFVMI